MLSVEIVQVFTPGANFVLIPVTHEIGAARYVKISQNDKILTNLDWTPLLMMQLLIQPWSLQFHFRKIPYISERSEDLIELGDSTDVLTCLITCREENLEEDMCFA